MEKSYFKENVLVIHDIQEEFVASEIFQLVEGEQDLEYIVFIGDPKDRFEEFLKCFKVIEAAGGYVKNDKNEVLFIYRLGKWDLPKGKIEEGESINIAAVREVEEECGVTEISLGDLRTTTYHIYIHKGERIVKKTYWFDMYTSYNGKLTPQVEESIEKVSWLTEDEIQNSALKNTYNSIKNVVLPIAH